MTRDDAQAAISARFPGAELSGTSVLTVSVSPDAWVDLARFMKDTVGCRFFSFLTAIDWKEQGLEVVVRIDNLEAGLFAVIRTKLGAGVTACPSLVPIFRGANWMERECFDMFGIQFEGHPDLRRILLEDSWQGHPLLKSYAVDTAFPPYR